MKYSLKKYILFGLLLTLNGGIAKAQISGNIYLDVNVNGKKDANSFKEKGISGIRISAYNSQNQEIGSTLSSENGSYFMEIPKNQRVKLVFSNVDAEWVQTSSLVKFVESPMKEIDFGLMKRNLFIGDKPRFISTIFMNGQPQKDSSEYNSPALVQFKPEAKYNVDEFKKDKTREYEILAKVSEIGSVWGLAYNPTAKTVFSAAFLKRHAGLGALGLDGIYQTDPITKQTKPFIKLSTAGIDVGVNPHKDLSSKMNSASTDSETYSKIGKAGIGGMDWSEDGKTLYFINLNDKILYALDFKFDGELIVTDAQGYGVIENTTKFSLPSEDTKVGEIRPFAVKCIGNDVYIGAVNDGGVSQNSKDLKAMVYKLTFSKKEMVKVLDISLDYQRGKALKGSTISQWNPWNDDFSKVLANNKSGAVIYPQPILSDIEIDNEGNMIIALMDRFGHQVGTGQPAPDGTGSYIGIASGDILKAYRKKKDNFLLENNATIGKIGESEGKNNEQGPANGEFYFQESFEAEGRIIHEENGSGAIAYNPETDEIMYAVHEPVNEEFNNSGVKWLDNKTGKSIKGLPFFKDSEKGTFSKVNAIGDIEMVTESMPIIASNRVWMDCNENGIQESDELPMENVDVELWNGNEKITTVKTDADGYFKFDRLNPKTQYAAKVNLLRQKDEKHTEKLILTKANIGDKHSDSDALESDGFAVINFTTESPGNPIFNKDFGFFCVQKPNTKLQWTCKSVDDGKIEISLFAKDFKENERFLLNKGKTFAGISKFQSANVLNKNESILKVITDTEMKQDFTLRAINDSGCFQDFTLNVSVQTCQNLLSDDDLSKLIIVYPNPVSDKLNFAYKSISESESISVSIVDMQGKILQKTGFTSKTGNFSGSIDVNSYTNGSYIISISDSERKINRGFVKL
jgi:SdrD B-like domain/Secretion system C-terminal sorting domain